MKQKVDITIICSDLILLTINREEFTWKGISFAEIAASAPLAPDEIANKYPCLLWPAIVHQHQNVEGTEKDRGRGQTSKVDAGYSLVTTTTMMPKFDEISIFKKTTFRFILGG